MPWCPKCRKEYQEDITICPDCGSELEEAQQATMAAPYQNSLERAEENRSSGWVLLVVGGLGFLVIFLGMIGVLPVSFGTNYLLYGVMSAVFLLFMVMGGISMKNARIFAKKAESENSLQNTLLAWCRENLTAENIGAEIESTRDDTEETLYFKRCDYIKGRMNHQFMNLDQAFLEHLIDEKVYEMVFGEEKESTGAMA